MAPKTEDLDLDLPAQMLELGEMLSSVGSFRRVSPRQPGAKQPDVPQVEAFVNMVLTKATKDATARRLLGLRQNRDADRIRIKAVAILAWHALRLSSDSADLGELAASTADPKLPPFEALLRARNELGAAIAVDVIIGRTDGSDGPIRKAHLPGRTLEWLSGGKASMGHLTTSKLMGRLMPKGYDEPEEQTPAPAKIPSAKELRTLICERVIGLDEQVSALSSRLVMHLARAKMLRAGNDPGTGNQAILLAGNSGCGKTWLMEVAAKASHCPFASLSATAMTSEGFVGGKLDDLFRALVGKAKGEVQVARFGIAFADEWDKKASRFGRDVTTLAVTQEVLVPMQGGEFLISGKRSMERPVVFNSHGTFFAFAGAFDGLAELIRKKAGRTCIGFSAGTRTKQQEFILDAIRDYGYIREWVNRLTAVMFLPDPQLGSLEEAASGGVHYLGVTSRLGAWPYRDLLVSVAEEARHGRLPVGPFPRQSHLGLAERCYKERNYIGRYFSSLVAHASRQPKTIEERNSNDQTVLAMVRAGDWGTVSFRGLDSTVLRHIQEAAWDDLLAYCHETRSEELGRSFTSDGVMCETHKVNVGDTDEIADITTQLPQRIRDRL